VATEGKPEDFDFEFEISNLKFKISSSLCFLISWIEGNAANWNVFETQRGGAAPKTLHRRGRRERRARRKSNGRCHFRGVEIVAGWQDSGG
jgi:hypothetical protein